ncbi:MAG: hypothetical protein IBJ18_03245 [Phycisphaerales bacterium]|nr:hypothetical protein [Phycisphaerales bacterium]
MTIAANPTLSKQLAAHGQAAIRDLRRALTEIIESLNGDPLAPQELSRTFRIDKTLAWRLSRAIREEDPWLALQHLPGRSGLGIFEAAMERAGASAERLEVLKQTIERFEDFVSTHARDRETLEMIVSMPKVGTSKKRLEAFRKSGYQCNSSLLGVRATMQFSAQLLAPSRTEGMLDLGLVGGLTELCRLRANMPWAVATVANWGSNKSSLIDDAQGTVPLIDRDPTSNDGQSPLLDQFCRPGSLQVKAIETSKGVHRYMLAPGAVGYSASTDVVYGWVNVAAVPPYASVPGETGDHCLYLNTPCEEVVFDLFVHESLTFAHTPSVRVFSMFPGMPQYPDPLAANLTLPVPTDLLELGQSIPEPPSKHLTKYDEMLSLCVARMGRGLNEFIAFRYRLAFPPVPSMVCLSHPLLTKTT